jgi:hypothetical protein
MMTILMIFSNDDYFDDLFEFLVALILTAPVWFRGGGEAESVREWKGIKRRSVYGANSFRCLLSQRTVALIPKCQSQVSQEPKLRFCLKEFI